MVIFPHWVSSWVNLGCRFESYLRYLNSPICINVVLINYILIDGLWLIIPIIGLRTVFLSSMSYWSDFINCFSLFYNSPFESYRFMILWFIWSRAHFLTYPHHLVEWNALVIQSWTSELKWWFSYIALAPKSFHGGRLESYIRNKIILYI